MLLPTDRVFSGHLVECPATRRRNAPDALDARNKGGRASSGGGKRRRGIVSQLCEGVTKYIAAQDIHIRIGMEQDLQLDVKCMMVSRRSVCLKSLVGNDLLTPIRHATL